MADQLTLLVASTGRRRAFATSRSYGAGTERGRA